MYLDKQTAKEQAEAVLWWCSKMATGWNATFGKLFGWRWEEAPAEPSENQAPSDGK
jgi:hypothetical protein